MLTEREKSLTRGLMDAVKEAIAPLREENAVLRTALEILKARVDERPVAKDGAPGRDGKDAPPIDVDVVVERLKAHIPAPLKGDRGEDGKDAPPVDVAALLGQIKELIPPPLKGEPGRDAEPIDIDAIVEKVTAKVLAQIPPAKDGRDGKDGPPGADGKDGASGKDGANGKDGASVDPLVVRAMVLEEVQKAAKEIPAPRDGKDGRDGRDGTPGSDGRDAAALEFVALDVEKSYPRGTFARHKGGVWYAATTTHGMEGWLCVAPGIAGVKAALLSDGRTFEFSFEHSDGQVTMQRAKAPLQKHCGVWRDGITYEPGDQVQLSGSSWQAVQVTAEKPGDSKAWMLIARRGRDGKDAA